MSLSYYKLNVRAVLVASILLSISFILLNQSKASADANYSITMTPSSTQLSAPPGGSASSSLAVVNEGNSGYAVAVSVAPYHVLGVNYSPEFSLLPGKTDASKWVSLNAPATQTLAAGKLQSISYSLNVPAGTAPGGYYAVIFAEAIPPSGAGVTALNRVGDILYITVDGPVVQSGSISSASLPHLYLGSNLPLGVLVRDTGGLHFLTNVHIMATSLLGHSAFSANLQRYVLPGTQRLVTTSWSNLPLFGIYKISRSATVLGTPQSLPTTWVVIIRPWLLVVIILLFVSIATPVVSRHWGKSKKTRLPENEHPNVRG